MQPVLRYDPVSIRPLSLSSHPLLSSRSGAKRSAEGSAVSVGPRDLSTTHGKHNSFVHIVSRQERDRARETNQKLDQRQTATGPRNQCEHTQPVNPLAER